MPLDRAILAELRRRQQNGLYAVAVELTNRAKELATRHTDNGTRRNSITQTKSEDGRSVLWGIPINSAPHAVHLEFGFKPHWVPGKYIGVWMGRHNVGMRYKAANRLASGAYASTRRYKKARSMAMGVFVGGPGSTLDYARGGARGRLFGPGGKLRTRMYKTKGKSSALLTSGTVGHPILRPVAEQVTEIPLEIYQRGFERGR